MGQIRPLVVQNNGAYNCSDNKCCRDCINSQKLKERLEQDIDRNSDSLIRRLRNPNQQFIQNQKRNRYQVAV